MSKPTIGFIVIALVFTISVNAIAQDGRPYYTEPKQDIHARFRLFDTENIFNFLELDTRTGTLSQIQISIGKAPAANEWINKHSLLLPGDTPRDGRFTLYPTDNIYNFILVDQDTSRTWQCQWGLDPTKRLFAPLPVPLLDDPVDASH